MKDTVAYLREIYTHSAEEPAMAKPAKGPTSLDVAKEIQQTLDALLPFVGPTVLKDLWHANDLALELVERLTEESR